MRIINVVEIINGEFNGIKSWYGQTDYFAKDYFEQCVLENGGLKEDYDTHIENGYYESKDRDYKVYLSWSNLN